MAGTRWIKKKTPNIGHRTSNIELKTALPSELIETAIHIMVRKLTATHGSSLTVQQRAGAGSIRGSLALTELTRRTRAIRKITLATAGASPGRAIAASYIIERVPRR